MAEEFQYHLRNIDEEIYRRAKARASLEGINMRVVFLRALEQYAEGEPVVEKAKKVKDRK